MPRGGTNYIPRPDADFAAWVNNYHAAVKAWWSEKGLDLADLEPLEQALDAWNAGYPAHVAARAAAESARREKDESRAALERAVRPVTNFIQSYFKTTDAERAAMGITVRDRTKTPAPPPDSAPLVRIENGGRLTHRVRFADSAVPLRAGRPPGTLGAEVWLSLTRPGEPPPPPGDAYRFLAVSSSGSLRAEFGSGDAGMTAHYTLRWVSTRGEKGPWSAVAAATVAA